MKSVGELSAVCSLIVLKCLYLAHISGPDILWSVNKLVRAITKWTRACDKRLARLVSDIRRMWMQTMLSCAKYSTTMQAWMISKFWFCRRSRTLKINNRMSSMHFRESHVCSNNLDVQEADISVTQLHRSWNNFSRCRFTHGWNSSSCILPETNSKFNNTKDQVWWNSSRDTTSNKHTQNLTKVPIQHDNFDLSNVSSRFGAMLFILEDNVAAIEMTIEGRSLTHWDMYSEPRELLWIGCLTGLILILKFWFDMLTPNTN